MHGPEARGVQLHHGILSRQPSTANALAPECLSLDDPAELPVVGAVVLFVPRNIIFHLRFPPTNR